MTIKYLKTSGGDWSTLSAMNAAVIAAVNAGLSDDWEIRVGNGQVFAGKLAWTFTVGKFQGHSIRITSDIVTPTSLGKIVNTASNFAINISDTSAGSDSGTIYIENLIITDEFGNSECQAIHEDGFLGSNRTLYYRNNFAYMRNTDSESGGLGSCISSIGVKTGTTIIANNHLFFSDQYYPNMNLQLIIESNNGMFANNFVGSYSIASLTVTTGKNTNNTIYEYNEADTFTVTGTAVNLTRGINPNTVQAVIQAASESVATMSARNAMITATSTSLLDNASATYLPTTDAIGTVRPQGAVGDRGACEYPVIVPVTPTTTINQLNRRRVSYMLKRLLNR